MVNVNEDSSYKKEFKQYKKGINQIFEVPTKNELTIQEIKETVLDQSKDGI